MSLKTGTYYKHINGNDAVIHINKISLEHDGIWIRCTWHILNYAGEVGPAISYIDGVPVFHLHFLHDKDIGKWIEYRGEGG